jgi:hypothetical protein
MRGYPFRLRATFETWIVRKPNAMLSEIPGSFDLEIRLLPFGKGRGVSYRYHVHVGTALNEFSETFAESKLEDCQNYIRAQFKKQLTDWEVQK